MYYIVIWGVNKNIILKIIYEQFYTHRAIFLVLIFENIDENWEPLKFQVIV